MTQEITLKRCAVYTRKSTDEGLEREFNSLDAQYEACSNYIRSQVGQGWRLLEKRYDDGGYSGGNMRRPGLHALMEDVEAGLVDVVVVYKIDRLSRSIIDFMDISKQFEAHGVSFVSVTQQIDTSTAAGRMMQNILMSFAQFEREMASDRVRDKMHAARKRGMWVGGYMPYGYKSVDRKLRVVPVEAANVRTMFRRYIETASTSQVARELNDGGRLRKDGDKWMPLHILKILRNPIYIGKIALKSTGETFEGQHEAIVTEADFAEAQRTIESNAPIARGGRRQAVLAPLKGLLRCGTCGGAMTPVFSNFKGRKKRRYIYYRCVKNAKKGEHTCEVENIAGDIIEKFVYTRLGDVLGREDVVQLVCGDNEDKRRVYLSMVADMPSFWEKMVPAERDRLLHLLVREVRVWADKVVIKLTLGTYGDIVVPCSLRRNLGRQCFVIEKREGEEPGEAEELAVPLTLRRTRKWLELLTSGTYKEKVQLSKTLGLTPSYFTKIMRIPFLSPVIVEKALNGDLPDISVTQLYECSSPFWYRQHERLGID